jgi:sulfhydrogenase subunit delta
MRTKPPVKLAWLRFTSCSGCQLMLLNCEHALTELAGVVQVDSFPLASSASDMGSSFDIALVEGAVSTPEEIERLLALRRKTNLLVAVGACALTGGVNLLVKGECRAALAEVHGTAAAEWDTFPPQPVARFVKVDWQIPGCPPERHEILNCIAGILQGGWPGRQVMAVCMECRSNEYRCLLIEDRAPCLGPVTSAGCDALCPGQGVPCEGCRGLMPEANLEEMCRLLLEAGLSVQQIRHRMERFGEALE